MKVLKVSGKSLPKNVAGATAHAIREDGETVLSAIGAGAVNQAVKSIAIARAMVASEGIDLWCVPGFLDQTLEDGKTVTTVRLTVAARPQ